MDIYEVIMDILAVYIQLVNNGYQPTESSRLQLFSSLG